MYGFFRDGEEAARLLLILNIPNLESITKIGQLLLIGCYITYTCIKTYKLFKQKNHKPHNDNDPHRAT